MIRQFPPLTRRVLAGLVRGLSWAATIRLGVETFGWSPRVVALAGGAWLLGAALAPHPRGATRSGRAVAGLLAVGLVAGAQGALAFGWRAGGTDVLAALALGGAGAVGWGASRPLGREGGRAAALSTALVLLLGVRLGEPLGLGVGAALVGLLLPLLGDDEPAPPPAREAGAFVSAAIVGALAVAGGLAVWSVVRIGLDPSPGGVCAVVAGAAGAAALSRGRATAGAGLLALGAASAWLASPGGLDAALKGVGESGASVPTGLMALAGVGVAVGLVLGGRRPGAAAVALLLGPLLADAVLSRLPPDVVAAATAPRATLLGDPVRADSLAKLHGEWTNAQRGVSTGGGAALWTRGDDVLVELDGVVADPSTRAAQAERFAGVLASCLTSGRSSARVAGDDLGLALLALRAQGFGNVDASAPDRALARALADAVPVLGRGWLAPGVRLLPVAGPTVLRLGAPADAVVEIVRAPWSDATRALPDAAALADVRRTLAPGGVHLLALSTPTLPPSVTAELLRRFVAVYPSATLWLPPAGADTAILAGRVEDGPVPWSGLEACASGQGARSLGLASALDIAGLLLADAGQLRALPPGSPPWFGLPPASPVPGPPPLAELDWRAAPAAPVFDAAAPAAEVAARHETLLSFLDLLRTASTGDLDRAVATARGLAGAPGGNLALRPLVRPQLDRVRAAMARGEREGLASKAWEEAETALTSARVLAPDYPETRCVEGDLAVRRGQIPRAEDAFQACLHGEPGSLPALDGLATVRRLQDDRIGLEKVLREAREAHPEAWTTAHNLGFFLYSIGRWDEAERWLVEGASLNDRGAAPSSAPSLALGHLYLDTRRPALALAQGVRAGQIEPSAEASFIRGAARYDLGQYEAAEAEFRDALRQDADHVRARGGLGLVLAQRGEYAAAAEAFKAVLARDPRNTSAADNLRRVQELVGGRAP